MRPASNPLAAISALYVLWLLGGCASVPQQFEVERAVAAWVEPGRTTRAEVLFALGMPRAAFEADSIFVYGIACASRSRCRAEPIRGRKGEGVDYQLVLVFDPAGRLEQRVLLRELHCPEAAC